MRMGLPCLPWFHGISLPLLQFLIASHAFHSAEMYDCTHNTGSHGYRISLLTTNSNTAQVLVIELVSDVTNGFHIYGFSVVTTVLDVKFLYSLVSIGYRILKVTMLQ
jgi:uncharacterized membrane protein